jgi:hypothetical protein
MNVICPRCLADAAVTVDVDDGSTLRCPDCGEDYSVDDVAAIVESWGRLLPWLKAHPARVAAAAGPGTVTKDESGRLCVAGVPL